MNMKNEIMINDKITNEIRGISLDIIECAEEGHPGICLGAAPIIEVLYFQIMKYYCVDNVWINRDRFVMSSGHGAALIYAVKYILGELTKEDICKFRRLGSKTPGLLERAVDLGIESTTGALGQGVGNAVGLAMAERYYSAVYNKEKFMIIDHYTYFFMGEGCLMEGSTYEALSFAGMMKLNKLIGFLDYNSLTIEGDLSLVFKEDIVSRMSAMGWSVRVVDEINSLTPIIKAVEFEKKVNKPSLIIVKSILGFGAGKKENKSISHGKPLGREIVSEVKKKLGLKMEKFYCSREVKLYAMNVIRKQKDEYEKWTKIFKEYTKRYPNSAKQLMEKKQLHINIDLLKNIFNKYNSQQYNLMDINAIILNDLSKNNSNIIGGSADLNTSTRVTLSESGIFNTANTGKNIYFGVREAGMGAICNGLAEYNNLIVYCSTYFAFSDYLKYSIRMASYMNLGNLYFFTHEGYSDAGDGITHETVEQLAGLRSIPEVLVFRPADINELVACWLNYINYKYRTSVFVLSRKLCENVCDNPRLALRGGYVVFDNINIKNPDVVLFSSGTEVKTAIAVAKSIREQDIFVKVVSIPSFRVFDEQSEEYKESVLTKACDVRISIEAGSSFGWGKYIGINGYSISVDDFGGSGRVDELDRHYGFTVEKITEYIMKILNRGRNVDD